MSEIAKTRCISDAHIQFVSLVDKAANKKSFLIAKAEDGKATFSAYGKIVKTDSETHYVTGIVYEPMVEDSQGDYMTADEIRKAAHWFAKNGSGIDIQHNYEKFEKAEVVESWIAPADFEINKEKIKKGSWLMTVEISDQGVWSAVEKGEITGFSMGGQGVCSEEDIDLSNLDKSKGKSILKKLAKALGLETEEKESEENMTKSEITEFIKETIAEFLNSEIGKPAEEPVEKTLDEETKKFIVDSIKEMLTVPEKEESITKEDVSQMLQKALEPLYQARGIPTNLNNEPEPVKKSEDEFAGVFI